MTLADLGTSKFIRLSESLRSLPELKRAVASGEVAWTNAREVATVATPASEGRWVAVAITVSLRFTPEQFARFEALVGAAHKQGDRRSSEEVVLAALEGESMRAEHGCALGPSLAPMRAGRLR